MSPQPFLNFSKNFLIGGKLFHNVVLVSAGTKMWISHNYLYILFLLSLPSPSFPSLGVLADAQAGLHMLHSSFSLASYLHMIVNICQCYSLNSSHPLLQQVHLLLHSFPSIPVSFCSELISTLLQPLTHGNHSSVFYLYSFAFSRMFYKEIIQNITVRTRHETTDCFQIGKGVRQGYILSPCLFNLYAEYIMQNAWLDEAQAGIKIARTNINNLRYADDTPLMAESEEELKSLLIKVKMLA